ncbi:MAG TPA: metallophosphoesterase, partial [Rhizomicrobium sp.]
MRLSRRSVVSSLLLSLAAPGGVARAADLPIKVDAAAGEFCLVDLPDTQHYASTYPAILRAQLRWIRDSVAALNIRMVVHVGDITDFDSTPEWALVDADFELLDEAVPYLVVPGNHDFNIPLRDKGIKT